MSSTYRVVCLNHDPALELGAEWNNVDSLLADQSTNGHWELSAHPACDLMITRTSGALVELGCPPKANHQNSWHRDIQWIEVAWLRLMVAVLDSDTPAAVSPLSLFRSCWAPARVARLRHLLATGDTQ